jgi:hypothetical protein
VPQGGEGQLACLRSSPARQPSSNSASTPQPDTQDPLNLGHGGNDAQKTMGIISALLVGSGYLQLKANGDLPVPLWVVLSAQAAIALGTLSGGWRIVKTLGRRITALKPVGGFSAETAAALTYAVTVSPFALAALALAAIAVVAALVVARRRTSSQPPADPGQPAPAPFRCRAPDSGG